MTTTPPKKKATDAKKTPAAPKAAPARKPAAAPKATKAAAPVVKAKEENKAAAAMTAKLKGIRIRLSAFDHTILDEATMKIIDTAMRTGAVVHGPIPLPTKIRKFTVNRSTFVHKDARDQFEMRIHRRLIDLTESTFKTVDALQNLSLPAGVEIDIKMG